MKIYTKTGDLGDTGLFAGPRVRKCHPRIEAYGAVDELNSLLGVVRAEPLDESIDAILGAIQHELFALGAELATPNAAARKTDGHVGAAQISRLETEIDLHEERLPQLQQFILPAGSRVVALLHLARTVCRRSERDVVALADLPDEDVSATAITYLNRLSDLLFVLARSAAAGEGVPDVPWRRGT